MSRFGLKKKQCIWYQVSVEQINTFAARLIQAVRQKQLDRTWFHVGISPVW